MSCKEPQKTRESRKLLYKNYEIIEIVSPDGGTDGWIINLGEKIHPFVYKTIERVIEVIDKEL